jgi:pSer/pThr/pTyr-binding forkhead associated (FHA) protein
VKRCPKCHEEVPESARVCPRDGCRLGRATDAFRAAFHPYDARLTIMSQPDEGTECTLIGDIVDVGQGPENDIVLADPNVSQRHMTLRLVEGEWHVFDAGSGGGTYVNGHQVGPSGTVLRPGDVVQLGSTRLTFGVAPSEGYVPAEAAQPAVPAESFPPHTGPVAPPKPRAAAAAAAPATEPHVVAILPDGSQRSTVVRGGVLTIGQSPDNGLVVADPSVSHHHAVVRAQGSEWRIYDVGSLNGSYVNGDRVGVAGHPILPGNVITVGHSHLHFSLAPVVTAAPSETRLPDERPTLEEMPTYLDARLPDGARATVALVVPVMTIGREAGNALVLADPSVSHRHATMRLEGDWWRVYDAGSRNGTYVNGERVGAGGYSLLHDDVVTVGRTEIRLGFGPPPGVKRPA